MTGQPPETPPPPAEPRPVLPWERPGAPFFESLVETAKRFLSRPVEAYESMPVTPQLARPIAWIVIFGWIGIIASQIWSILLRTTVMSLLPQREGMSGFVAPIAVSVVFMVLAPILVLIGLFVWSAIVHLFLLMLGGAGSGFTATVRVICYAHTTDVLQVVPFCGGLIAGVWGIVLSVLGLAVAHRTTRGKALLAVLLPLALCCVCVVAIVAIFGTAMFAALSRVR